jgi:cell division septum initiation protein DivIVA
MDTSDLINMLLEIGKASAAGDNLQVETLAIDAQNVALEIERSLAEAQHENARLRAIVCGPLKF